MGACIICGKPTYTQNARHCQECRVAKNKEYRKRTRKRQKEKTLLEKKPPKKPENKIEAVMKELTRYNKKHGTRYNYGEYTALKKLGKV